MKTKCSTPKCQDKATMGLLGNHPICRKCGDEKNRKSRIRSAARRAEGLYSPSIMARWSEAKKERIIGQPGKNQPSPNGLSGIKAGDTVLFCSKFTKEQVTTSSSDRLRIRIGSKCLSFNRKGRQIGGNGKHWLESLQ